MFFWFWVFVEDVIGEFVEIGQWNLHGKPKKVVFTMKDEWYSLVYYYKNQKLLVTFISFRSFLVLPAF